LPPAFAGLGNSTQTAPTFFSFGIDVIAYENQHLEVNLFYLAIKGM
jgi:hypothetical protein